MSQIRTPTHPAVMAFLVLSLLATCGRQSAGPTGPSGSGASGSIFSDDFESGNLEAWQDGLDFFRHRIVADSTSAQSGGRYLAVTYPAGRDGGWLTRFLTPRDDSLYVRYYVRFPE